MSGIAQTLEGAGGHRSVVVRWVVTGDLVLKHATHLGGEADGAVDMNILRDRGTGGPLLTGASLAGALRSHLSDRLAGYFSTEPQDVERLFGAARGRDDLRDVGEQSRVIVFDCQGRLPQERPVEIRDGVAIAPATGTAAENAKFDLEVLPAGTTFAVRMDLLVPSFDDEGSLLSQLVAALSGLTPGEISIGARRTRGLGEVESRDWRAQRFPLDSVAGWLTWLRADPKDPIRNTVPFLNVRQAVEHAGQGLRIEELPDRRRRVRLDARLRFHGGLLVRSPAVTPDAPDVSQLRSGGSPVMPGTSLAGAIRNRALRVARWVRRDLDEGEAWVRDLFGPRLEKRGAQAVPLFASRVRVYERDVKDGEPMRVTRTQIDHFTQGVMPRALFDEEPDSCGRLEVHLELRDDRLGEVGLLLLTMKDLLAGRIGLGGTGSVGRGAVRQVGPGSIRFDDGGGHTLVIELPEPGVTSAPPAQLTVLDEHIRNFHRARLAKEGGR